MCKQCKDLNKANNTLTDHEPPRCEAVGKCDYCDVDCARNDGWETCEYCGEWCRDDDSDTVYINDCGFYCSSECVEADGYACCEYCSEWHNAEDMAYFGDGAYFCDIDCAKYSTNGSDCYTQPTIKE